MTHSRDVEDKIRLRAYQLWDEEGRPSGRDKEHWQQAEAELVAGQSPPVQPEISAEQGSERQQKKSPFEGGLNPDDITR